MGVFEVGPSEFDGLESFNSSLAEVDADDLENDLYIVAGFSHLDAHEFYDLLRRRGYTFADLGAIKQIRREYRPSGDDDPDVAEFYLYYDEESGLILLYTDMRKTEEIDNTIGELLAQNPGVHYLHVSPQIFRRLRRAVHEETHAQITRFIADRSENSDYPARIRGDYKRTIQYHGDDGLETLAEMETNYGVKPRNITFNITNVAKFRVTREGIFALEWGDIPRFFDYIELCVSEALEVKKAFDASSFEMLSTTDKLSVPTSEPAAIHLENSLEYEEVSEITAKMEEEDYLLVDSFKQEGSVYFATKVIDTRKESTFRMRATDDVIRVFPQQEEGNVGSFLRFHEFVQDNVDADATVTATG